MSVKNYTKFVVIEWINNPLSSDGKKSVDMVPVSWLCFKNDTILCQYPPENEYNKLDDWVAKSINSKKKWESWECRIVKEASKLQIFYSQKFFKFTRNLNVFQIIFCNKRKNAKRDIFLCM